MPEANERGPARGREALIWWRSMQRLTPNPNADTGALARLRRAGSPIEAAQEAQTNGLYRRLFGGRWNVRDAEATTALAATLAHVREHRDGRERTAALLGTPKGENQPLMSDLRMRRLCAARDGAEAMSGFREAVLLLGGRAPIPDLAESVLDWLDDDRGDRRRTRWLFDYHGAGIAAPSFTDETKAEATP
jgi:CRISPR system Cascade subunit CasB